MYHMRFRDKEQMFCDYTGKRPNVWVWNVSYYSHNVIEESFEGNLTMYALRLDRMLQEITRLTGQSEYIIIAHSMGGLVVRKYMTLKPEHAQSVVKVVTVGSPHEGVFIPIPIGGQLQDLAEDSLFFKTLNREWEKTDFSGKWGVVAGVDPSILTENIKADTTDLGGFGFVQLRSSIPFGEWKSAVGHLGKSECKTAHFGFRMLVRSTHNGLLDNPGTLEAISWAVKK